MHGSLCFPSWVSTVKNSNVVSIWVSHVRAGQVEHLVSYLLDIYISSLLNLSFRVCNSLKKFLRKLHFFRKNCPRKGKRDPWVSFQYQIWALPRAVVPCQGLALWKTIFPHKGAVGEGEMRMHRSQGESCS